MPLVNDLKSAGLSQPAIWQTQTGTLKFISENNAMYWLDIVSISILFVFGIMGFSGWFNRLRGFIFGILLGVFIIGLSPLILTKFDTDTRIDLKKSVIIRYFDQFVPVSIKSKYQGKVVNTDR